MIVQSFPIFPPPPPPTLPTGDGDGDKEQLYSMLISWYMCGYYTGFYQVQHTITSQLSKYRKCKEKMKRRIFIYRLYTAFSLRVLRHGSHSFTCKLHHACLSFVSVHQMAPLVNVVVTI